MKNTITRSLIIAAVVGLIFTISLNLLTATYFVQEGITGSKMVLTGIEAIQKTINEFGVLSYLRTLFGYFIVFFLAVFTGCLWLNKWNSNVQ